MRLTDADALEEKAYWIQGEMGAVEVVEMNDVYAAAVSCNVCTHDDSCLVPVYAIADEYTFGCALFERKRP